MSTVLIVGNVIKDVYLHLDERYNHLETDANGTAWMDLAFDGSNYNYFRRTSVFAGAAVSLEVLTNFGLEATIAGCDFSMQNRELSERCLASNYRYILCRDDEIAYLTPTERSETKWVAPTAPVDWVLVDRSALITPALAQQIMSYLSLSRQTKLAVYLGKNQPTEAELQLAQLAEVVFAETELEVKLPGKVFVIQNDTVALGAIRQKWQLDKADLMTHLTAHSIVASTILGALIDDQDEASALQLAKLNVEHSKLTGTASYDDLMEKLASAPSHDLTATAKTLVAPGKGILAADESGGSIHKKFLAAGIPDDEIHRRDYRNIFFTTPDLAKYASGVILFDETARQKADDGRDFVSYLTSLGIVPGIKVDQGLEDMIDADAVVGEKYTKGLDGLPERLAEYYAMGLRFAKWRAAFEVSFTSDGQILTPSDTAIARNCQILAQYARDCQDAGIVPIVEPELVYDGDYGLDVAKAVNGKIFDVLFVELKKLDVDLRGCLLKCSMTLAGKRFALGPQSTPAEVGQATAEVLRAHVPAELAGVVFLSGGQSVEQATDNLQAVTNCGPFPWPVTFSFARALQDPALEAWQGDNNNADAARAAFFQRLVKNSEALKKTN